MNQRIILFFLLCIFFIPSFAQTDEQLGLHSEGGAWNFFPTSEPRDSLSKVLLIGDSVMNGYHKSVTDSLKKQADVDYWLTPKHLKSEHLLTDLAKVVSYRKYQVIHFNIGLHGWPEGRILPEEYESLLEEYVKTIQENAPQARLIWGNTTPVTEKGKTALNHEINPVIVRRNIKAARVMKKYNVPVNDLYGLVVGRLDLARGDRFHWKAEGYSLMAYECVRLIRNALAKELLSDAKLIWGHPSENAMGSMPAGNGDVGINLWVEENGDLLFYLSKTDAWSENARLLKLGKVRLSLKPNPFKAGIPYWQELDIENGRIRIEAGKPAEKTSISVWVDANHPVVEIDVESQKEIAAQVSTEPWRTNRRQITNKNEIHSAYGINGGPDVFVEKDTILTNQNDGIVFVHHNKRSIWKDNLSLQGLEKFTSKNQDPLKNRTFGGLIRAAKLKKTSPVQMESKQPLKSFSVSVYALTDKQERIGDWQQQINKLADSVEELSKSVRWQQHQFWWNKYWKTSYISLAAINDADREEVLKVNRGYLLQRYMNACSGRGNSPIKFNGSIFTVDTYNLEGQYQGFDADYRRWGGPYWWQNTRLPYWSMLESGDFELMEPLFNMYREALEVRKLATKTYYGHKGAFFPETMYFWGTYVDSNYGRDRSELPLGMTQNRYIRYYWQSGLEISLMMLDYYAFTKNDEFLKETLLPVVSEVINFYDQHWGRDKNGKILFDPAMALETYNTAINPLPEIVGINKVCTELLNLPKSAISKAHQKQWERIITELPDIPVKEADGQKVLIPAWEYSGKQNVENPELYAIFPYRAYGIGKEDLKMARETFARRANKQSGGWQQNAIKAALLGLSDEAAELTAFNFKTSNTKYRFPAMWGPNYDWTPDQDHGSVAMSALQRMLVQYDGDKIYLFPAWPNKWDVQFKLHAPHNTTIEVELKNGKIEKFEVLPSVRKKDIKVCWN